MAFVKKTPAAGSKEVAGKKPAATAVAKKPIRRPATAAPARPARITFDAPSDMKPCFIELAFRTQADGLIGPSFRCLRVRGNWTNEAAKRFDMMEYDAPTVVAIISRIAARTFATNALRRLPANTAFKVILRAGMRKADGTIIAGIKSISKQVKSAKTGKATWKELVDKTDPVYRKMRSCARFMPGAFVHLQLPPSTRRGKKEDDSEE
jgi:hypothetical protein